ncbi:MAG: type II toxin-antitoxin system VapC family toxin [Desulfobulbaceae bacterium]|nr:type II toxin-antitoxin system VapC family toxin [Desulfobulbaceae bacterium]
MSLVYIDTSALAKWYLPEANSEAFADWMQEQTETCISSLTVTEFRCLLARRQRMGLLNALQVQELYAKFQQDIEDSHLLRYAVNDRHICNAELIIESLPAVALRTLDALHLTIAHDLGAAALATADKIMAEAAALLEMEVVRFDCPPP